MVPGTMMTVLFFMLGTTFLFRWVQYTRTGNICQGFPAGQESFEGGQSRPPLQKIAASQQMRRDGDTPLSRSQQKNARFFKMLWRGGRNYSILKP